MMGSVGDELLVARLRADESRRWRRGASTASGAGSLVGVPRSVPRVRASAVGLGLHAAAQTQAALATASEPDAIDAPRRRSRDRRSSLMKTRRIDGVNEL